MKVYLDLINKKDGRTRERVDVSHYFERFSPSSDIDVNNYFFDCWLADRAKELKRKYFPRKHGYLMLWGVYNTGTAI